MNYSDLINAKEAIANLSNEKLSIKEAVALSRMIKKMNEELEIFKDNSQKILGKYGTQNEDGDYTVNAENVNLYNAEMMELLETNLEFEYDIITIKSEVKISATDVILMEKFISFDIE